RPTNDADVVIAAETSDAGALLAMATRHGYLYDEAEAQMFAEGGLLRLWVPPDRKRGFGVDLLFADSDYLRLVLARATEVDVVGTRLMVATTEDLVLLKLDANRAIDIDDILTI